MIKLTKFFAVIMMAAATFAGCSGYDDSDIKKDLAELEGRIDNLEELYDTLVAAQANGLSISSYTSLPDGAGWQITFSNGFTLDILNGDDGRDGRDGTDGDKGDKGDKGDRGDSFIESIEESADGNSIVITLADGEVFTFPKSAPAVHIELVGFDDHIEIPEGETAHVRFRINPSDAFVPTGTGGDLDGLWMLDQSGARSRADISYVNPPANFELVSLLPDMAGANVKRGQYVATIRCTERDPDISEYAISLVLNSGTALVSSPMFVLGVPTPATAVTERYTTVAFDDPATLSEEEKYILVWSKRDATYNYYVYYAGHIDFVPLVYQQAVYYNGTTPITVGYSKDTSVETAVTRGLEKAVEESFEATVSLEVTVGTTASAGFMGTGVEVSSEISAGVSASLGGSVSTANTYETSEAKVEGETFSTEATIGTAGEPAGMYRYALFATTDVFYNVKVSRSTGKIVEATRTLSARPTTYWGIDYDPELGGAATFGKTGGGDKLGFPEFDPDNLPPTALRAAAIDQNSFDPLSTFIAITAINAYPVAGQQVTFYFTFDGSEPSRENGFSGTAPASDPSHYVLFFSNRSDAELYGISGLDSFTFKFIATMPGALDSPVGIREVRLLLYEP